MRNMTLTCQPGLVVGALLLNTNGHLAHAQTKITTIRVWANAFIPRDIPGLTFTVPGTGPHAGKTAIKGPFPGISDAFLTDQREANNNPSAEARLHHEVTVNVATGTFTEAKRCDPSIEVDAEDGDEECNNPAPTDRMKVLDFQQATQTDGARTFKFRFEGAASNGCFTGAPDIDWKLPVTLSVAPGAELLTARVDGFVDRFPAFEMYVSVNGQPATMLLKKDPPLGNTPTDLIPLNPLNPATETFAGETLIGAPLNGFWKSTDAAKRFELTISNSTVQWLERRPSSATQTRTATLKPISPGSNTYRIERPNDDTMLQFLEFSDAFLRQEILAKNPQPSFLLLTRQGDKITGEWHGLLVKKLANGRLDSIVQPKDMTGKIFEFTR